MTQIKKEVESPNLSPIKPTFFGNFENLPYIDKWFYKSLRILNDSLFENSIINLRDSKVVVQALEDYIRQLERPRSVNLTEEELNDSTFTLESSSQAIIRIKELINQLNTFETEHSSAEINSSSSTLSLETTREARIALKKLIDSLDLPPQFIFTQEERDAINRPFVDDYTPADAVKDYPNKKSPNFK